MTVLMPSVPTASEFDQCVNAALDTAVTGNSQTYEEFLTLFPNLDLTTIKQPAPSVPLENNAETVPR